MDTKTKRLDAWRARWARMKRIGELGISGLLLAIGFMLSVALLPELPKMVGGTLTGDGEAAGTLFVCATGISVCMLQWRWRAAIYPQLRSDTSVEETP